MTTKQPILGLLVTAVFAVCAYNSGIAQQSPSKAPRRSARPAPTSKSPTRDGWKTNEQYAAAWTNSFQSLRGQRVTLYGTASSGEGIDKKGSIAFIADDRQTKTVSQWRMFTAEVDNPLLAALIGGSGKPYWVTGTVQKASTNQVTVTAPDGKVTTLLKAGPYLVDVQLKEDR